MLKKIDIQKTPLTLEELLAQLSPDDEIMLLRDDILLARVLSSTTPQSDTSSQVSDAPEGSLAYFFDVIDKTGGVTTDTDIDPEKIDDIQQAEIRQIHLNAYAKAREYWRKAGDTEKANMTDDEMDIQFGAFDQDGIPRMKDELVSDAPEGSLAHALQILNDLDDDDDDSDMFIDASTLDDILRDEFGDYIYQRMNRGDHD